MENERIRTRIFKARCFETSIPSISDIKKYSKEDEAYRKLASHYHNCPNYLT